jgi:hypothetical protein
VEKKARENVISFVSPPSHRASVQSSPKFYLPSNIVGENLIKLSMSPAPKESGGGEILPDLLPTIVEY